MMRCTSWGQATPAKVARIWRDEGLKIPQKQLPRGMLWLNDGSRMRLRATHPTMCGVTILSSLDTLMVARSER